MADALSIEATNKVRANLGLPLLPVPGGAAAANKNAESSDSESDDPRSTLESRQAEGYDNWNQHQKEAAEKRKRQAKVDAIKKARDEAQRTSKLKGKSLGQADDDEDLSAKAWLKGSSKRQKKIEQEREKTRKIEEELRKREEQEYSSKDLAGLRVAHEAGDFDLVDGDQILTLKDATIEENEEEGDELENVQLAEKARIDERLLSKRKKPGYNPMDDLDGEKKILQQYDEVIDGKKRKHFMLNGEGEVDHEDDTMQGVTLGKARTVVNLDILKDLPSSDYQEPAEVKMKKSKKKKTKNSRQKEIDEDDIVLPKYEAGGDDMKVDPVSRPLKRIKDDSFDDEDLQLLLARQRRAALKQKKRNKPEDLAEQIRNEESATPDVKMEDEGEDGGLVIDETLEFISNLKLPEPNSVRQSTTANVHAQSLAENESDDEDVDMTRSYNDIPDSVVKKEDTDPEDEEANDTVDTGLGQETTVESGVFAALKLAQDRGMVNKAKEGESNEQTRERTNLMQEKARIDREVDDWAKRERERFRSSKEWSRMSRAQQETTAGQLNEERDRRKSNMLAQLMRDYKPSVQLKYVDEHGRNMNEKEAFKHMSHKFHGKSSGKQKTEKHLKKIEEEKAMEARSVLDGSANAHRAAFAGSKKHR